MESVYPLAPKRLHLVVSWDKDTAHYRLAFFINNQVS
jgi:hypothetical protein